METEYKILIQTQNACVSQCHCCTQLQVQYKNVMICFEWKDLIGFLQRLDELPPNELYYIINIIDLRCYPAVNLGVSASAMCLTFSEVEEFRAILSRACLKMDLEMIFRKSIHNN
ncbi:hypothetical protein LV89_03866 [Arcicella aurantiaca]|uniref:Uncharacterized protein n=1 Tax=Arcicella aurantiaca TaxID=591202 RepID=A0A316DQI4_9BACT|nr:DUF6686 family protein [Arcicella aurantiaca]PWK20056.1 hypothetical protein LV89_03866 [Arcicella aurantiaca]